MSRTFFRAVQPVTLSLIGCLALSLSGCRSTGTRFATLPGMGWLASDTDEASQLASDLPPPSSVASPDPIRPQDEMTQLASTAGHAGAQAQYPMTQYPALEGAGQKGAGQQGSGVRAASATSQAATGYTTGPYDQQGTRASDGAVAPPEKVAALPTQRGLYDASYEDTSRSGQAATSAGQSTWQRDPLGAASAPIPVAPGAAPPKNDGSTGATAAPNSVPSDAVPAASRQSGWEDEPAAAGPQQGDSGKSSGDFVPDPVASHADPNDAAAIDGATQQVTYEEPVAAEEAAATEEPAAASGGETSVYAATAELPGKPWRPGSTSSYR